MKTQIAPLRAIRMAIACAVLSLLVGVWFVADVEADSQESAPADTAPAAQSMEPKSPLQLLHLEIEAIVQAGRDRVTALESELEDAAGFEATLELHRAIERAKAQTEIELFQAQIVYAEKSGRVDLAETVRTMMTDLAERNGIELEDTSTEPAER